MKKIITRIFILIILVSVVPVTNVNAHYDSAYWNESYIKSTKNQRWMRSLSDAKRISKITMPGTHNSMAFDSNLIFRDSVRTQSLSLVNQLNLGIRFLDIRIKYEKNKFSLHHGAFYLGYDLEDVFKKTRAFLKSNPSETIVMRIKQENSYASNKELSRLFNIYHAKFKGLFWNASRSKNRSNPTLGELRGKVLLLPDILSIYHGINYRTTATQDNYHLNSNWDLYSKWEKVKNHFNRANTYAGNSIFINYLSASGGVMPYFVASGHTSSETSAARLSTGLTTPGFNSYYPDFPRVNKFGIFSTIAFEGTNTLAANYLSKSKTRYAGIVVADFPGERLIDSIIEVNNRGQRIENYQVYTLALKYNPSIVVDRNISRKDNITLYPNRGNNNQKWKFVYDYNKNAYQIKSLENENMILAWNDYGGSKNVFATPNFHKWEHYWILKKDEPSGAYQLLNYKNRNLALMQEHYRTYNLVVDSSNKDYNRSLFFIE